MELREVAVEPVEPGEEGRYQRLMAAHHYLGALPKNRRDAVVRGASSRGVAGAGRLLGGGAEVRGPRPLDRLGLPHPARPPAPARQQQPLLVLPGPRTPNLASRVLALCARRAAADWPARFGHPLLLLETFVDPARFRGTAYRAANWTCVGSTRGFRRVRGGYGPAHGAPKLVSSAPWLPTRGRA